MCVLKVRFEKVYRVWLIHAHACGHEEHVNMLLPLFSALPRWEAHGLRQSAMGQPLVPQALCNGIPSKTK